MKKFKTQAISFKSDDLLLQGVLHMPINKKPPIVIGSHGLMSSGDSPKQIALANHCNQQGIAYFRFDHRGCGKSDGLFNQVTSLTNRCKDLACAIKVMLNRHDISPVVGLFGSSFGGTTCLSTASDLSNWNIKIKIKAIVTFAAPLGHTSITRPSLDTKEGALLTPEFCEQYLTFDISDKLASIDNIMVFHGDADKVVRVEDGFKVYEKAKNNKELIIQRNGDHMMSNVNDQKQFIDKSVKWFKNLLIS